MSAVSPNGDVPESPRTATSSEPTAVEVITEADEAHQFGVWVEVLPDRFRRACTCGHLLDSREDRLHADMHHHRAQAVVAAIRAMSPQQQAELCPAAVAGALHAAADAMASDASLRSDKRCGAMKDTAHWLRRRADGITERGAS